MSTDLEGQVAVVTGGARGIGAAVAQALLEQGASVVICGRDASTLEQAVGRMTPFVRSGGSAGGRVEGRVCDVRRFEDVEQLFGFVRDTFGRLDVLVNNAGVGGTAPVDEMTPEQWRTIIETNLNGPFYCCHEAVPLMRAGGGGFIINIGSLAGKHVFAGGSAYNASKFGLAGFTEAAMLDLRHDNIRVSTIMPGSVDTRFSSPDAPPADWKIAPEHIGDTVVHLLLTPSRSLISRVEMRPSQPPREG